MPKKTNKIKNIFIKKMFYSLLVQIVVLGLLAAIGRSYVSENQLSMISDELLIKDQFTIDQIRSYEILDNKYALDLELHNLGDMRKLDTARFLDNIPPKISLAGFTKLLNNPEYKLYKSPNNDYIGITTIKDNGKTNGYVLMQKKYSSQTNTSISYDFFLLLLTVASSFIFNFFFLFLSLKNRVEKNTKSLLNLASLDKNLQGEFSDIDISEYNILADKLVAKKNEIERLEREKTLAETAALVAHDIRSPLAVLDINLQSLEKSIPEEKMLMLRAATQSVRDIANNLLERYRKQDESNGCSEPYFFQDDPNLPRLLLLPNLLEQVLSQKRHEWATTPCELSLDVTEAAKSCWVTLAPNEVKRVLSNLLNNAHDALSKNGIIKLNLSLEKSFLKLKIIDNGMGIPTEKIPNALKGESSKHEGKGLGLSSAIAYMSNLNGKLLLNSQENRGTEVTLEFPRCDQPTWFPQNISLTPQGTVMILDDDASMQALWLHRLQEHDSDIKIFSDYEEALSWYQTLNTDENITFLVDYELAEKNKNGLAFLALVKNKKYTYLITSHAEETEIQNLVEKTGVYLIPKTLASTIPIKN